MIVASVMGVVVLVVAVGFLLTRQIFDPLHHMREMSELEYRFYELEKRPPKR
jgi:hypothetical protein